jgi:hypothetical protein
MLMSKLYYKKFCLAVKDVEIIKKKYDLYLEFFNECFSNIINKEDKNLKKKQQEENKKKKEKPKEENKTENNKTNFENNLEHSSEHSSESIDSEDIKSPEEITPIQKFSNKLKKLISLKSHPDKVKGKEELFKQAMKAWDEDDLFNLIYVAGTLNITIPKNLPNSVYKNAITKMESKKKNLLNTYAWMWFEHPEKRNMLRIHMSNSWKISINELKKAEQKFDI